MAPAPGWDPYSSYVSKFGTHIRVGCLAAGPDLSRPRGSPQESMKLPEDGGSISYIVRISAGGGERLTMEHYGEDLDLAAGVPVVRGRQLMDWVEEKIEGGEHKGQDLSC